MAVRLVILAAAAAALSSSCQRVSGDASYPLLDGVCAEYPPLGASPHDLGGDVSLHVFQDAHYVWLCASLPPESLGALDLVIETSALTAPLNLHVSAQLGEWPADDPDAAPSTADSDRWWRIGGWAANPVRLNGFVDDANGRRAKFIPSEARELQIGKARFGSGEWRLRFQFRNIRAPDGSNTVVDYPALDEDAFLIVVE